MKTHSRVVSIVAFVTAMLAVVWMGCGSDDPAGPGDGGGGGTSSTLVLPAGKYLIEIGVATCSDKNVTMFAFEDSFCLENEVDEITIQIPEIGEVTIPCPIKVEGTKLSVTCTATIDVGGGCMVTFDIALSGTSDGDTVSVSGTIMATAESPADCYTGPDCIDLTLEATRIGPPPVDCPSTMDLVITGGPFAGTRTFVAAGTAIVTGDNIAFTVFAQYPPFLISPPATGGVGDIVDLFFTTPSINPSSLPQTFPVVVTGKGPATTIGGGPAVFFSYFEEQADPFLYFVGTGGSGTVTITALSADRITGSMNINITGLQGAGKNTPVPSSRSILGPFSVGTFNIPLVSRELRHR